MEQFSDKIFKTYDIRGIYPDEINEEAAYRIGRALVESLKVKSVVVGYDMRLSSPTLFDALARGINEQGANIIKIGMVTTPMLSFAIMRWNKPAGIMISASHNPGKYNAFKLIKNGRKTALQLYDKNGLDKIKNLAIKNDFPSIEKKGEIIKKNISAEYQKHLLGLTKNIKDLKIIVDYGNGVGSISAKPLFESLPIDYTGFFEKPDGSFPNHEANPQEIKNLDFLRQKVTEKKANAGIFFDGDADRSVIVDERGKIIFPDIMLGILACQKLEKKPGEKVYYDLRFTKSVGEEIKKHSGEPIMLRVGNPFYKEALAKDGGIIAGELSGHIMFAEHYSIDDGLFATLKFLSLMNETGKTASQLAAPFQKYFQTEEINMEVSDTDKVFDRVKAKYADGKLNTLDGILISYPNWWLSLRKSNTEPIIRLRLEADTKKLMEEKRNEVLAVIKK